MTSRKLFALIVSALLASGLAAQASTIAPPAGATAIFSDDFDSYADNSAFRAVWNGAPNPAVALDIGYGVGGTNAIYNAGGPVAQKNFGSTTFSDARPLVAEMDYSDETTGTSDKLTLGIRSTHVEFEIGEKNALDDGTGAQLQGYGFRALFVGAPAGSSSYWWAITTNKLSGWHHFKLEIGGTYATGSVTLSNGATYSRTIPLTDTVGKIVDNVRIGGPSGVYSTGISDFDNVQVYITPEPAGLLLIGLGGLLLRRRTRA